MDFGRFAFFTSSQDVERVLVLFLVNPPLSQMQNGEIE